MIRWITENIGTGAFSEVSRLRPDDQIQIIDVRDLVDKSGNDNAYIKTKVQESIKVLREHKKVVICCDYGMSRSNSIATGVIASWHDISFRDAIGIVEKKVDPSGIKIEVLNTVFDALYAKEDTDQDSDPILITGGSGFIGMRLLNQLSKSHPVYAPNSGELNLLNENISLYNFARTENIKTIVHLANPRIFTTNKSVGDTLVMLKNVLDVCRTNNIRFIYLSGWEVYSGYRSNGLLAGESLPLNPKGPYGEAKWLSELLIRQYHQVYGLRYQIIRSGPVYGTDGEKPKFVYNFINKALLNEDIVTHRYANGAPLLDFMYVDDLVSAITEMVSSSFLGEINIGTGRGTSTADIAQEICRLTGSTSKIRHTDIQDFAPNIIMDTSFAETILKWRPKVDIATGLRLILKPYKKIER